MESRRYIIISETPDRISGLLESIRHHMAGEYGSVSALEYPPHITLRTGVVVPMDKRDIVFDSFRRLTYGSGPFSVRTDGLIFSEYAKGKYLAGYSMAKDEALMRFNELLLTYREYRKSDKVDFQPHLTLLFDDLTKENFKNCRDSLTSKHCELPGLQWELEEYGFYYYVRGKWVPEEIIRL